jgi:hypothetical protein
LKYLSFGICNLVRAGSLVLMRCSSCGGRRGYVSVALPPIARAAAEKPKGAAELDEAAAKPKGAAELDAAAAAKPKGAAELEAAAAAKPKGAAELDAAAAAKPKGAAQLDAAAAKSKGAAQLINWLGFNAALAAGRAAEDTPKGLVKAAVPKAVFVAAAPKRGAARGAA